MKKGIIKTSISDYFPIFTAFNISDRKNESATVLIQQRNFNKQSKENFKTDLNNTDWSFMNNCENTNTLFDSFSNAFFKLYETHFLLETRNIKLKDINCPWMSKGMKKSSKQKQRL